jgi:hypothetical protein
VQQLRRLVVKKRQKKLVAKLRRKLKKVVVQKNKNLGLTFW